MADSSEEFSAEQFPLTIDDFREYAASLPAGTRIGNPAYGQEYHPYSKWMAWKYPHWKFDTAIRLLYEDERKQFSGEYHPYDLASITATLQDTSRGKRERNYQLPDWLILLDGQLWDLTRTEEGIAAKTLRLLLQVHDVIPHHKTGKGSWLDIPGAPFDMFDYGVMHGMQWRGAYLSSIKQAIADVIDTGKNYPFADHRVIKAWLEKFGLRPYDVVSYPPEIFQENIPGYPFVVVWPVLD